MAYPKLYLLGKLVRSWIFQGGGIDFIKIILTDTKQIKIISPPWGGQVPRAAMTHNIKCSVSNKICKACNKKAKYDSMSHAYVMKKAATETTVKVIRCIYGKKDSKIVVTDLQNKIF